MVESVYSAVRTDSSYSRLRSVYKRLTGTRSETPFKGIQPEIVFSAVKRSEVWPEGMQWLGYMTRR
jgi:hypothetical protein